MRLKPADAVAMAGLASAYHGAERAREARDTFAQAVALNRKSATPSPIPNYLYARFLADEEDFKPSVVQYNLALKEDPDFLDAHFGRAEALVELHDWAGAAPDLERAVLEPKHEMPALALMVRVYRELGQTEKAKDCSQRLAQASRERDGQRVAGNEIAGQMQAASALMQEGKFEEAAQAYQRLVDGHPEATHAWLELGRCYAELERRGDAETAFRKALSLDDSSAVAHVLLGRVLLQEKETSSARLEFIAARRLDPLNVDASLGLAASDIVESQYRDAIRTLRETQRMAASNGEVRLMLAEALFKDGHREEAQREVNLLLKSDPDNPAARRMLDALADHSGVSP
jgi:tetratricopeptide (TPR) repeat protein